MREWSSFPVVLTILVTAIWINPAAADSRFTPLGDLDGGLFPSLA